ncbi:MAG: DUF115 domain-containing protein [Burkholderiales bacterium]|nr:DUF115 domain-containing protein [Burkholderiales bacterium]
MSAAASTRAAALAVIGARWPALLALLRQQEQAAAAIDLAVVAGAGGTLAAAGLQLGSRHDAAAESRVQAATLPQADTLHLYGPALGTLARHLLRSRPGLRRLEVHLMNTALFLRLLGHVDASDWLADPRLALRAAGARDEVAHPYFAHPAELALADDAAAPLRDRLRSALDLPYVRRTFHGGQPLLASRLEENRPLIAADRDVAELFGSAAGREAWVVGTGPTLEGHLDELRRRGEPGLVPAPLLIAVDTALRPLAAAGIQPDIAVSIDYRIEARHLLAPLARPCALVYAPVLEAALLRAWPGPRYCAYGESAVYDAVRGNPARATLHEGGSVIHPAVDLAVRMGCRRVRLLGVDFCFPGGRTHAYWGAGELRTELGSGRCWALDGHGARVPTQPNFASYRVELERYIARHPDVAFEQSSAASARIAGCTLRVGQTA